MSSQFAQQITGMRFCEASAKDNFNVDEIFLKLVDDILKKVKINKCACSARLRGGCRLESLGSVDHLFAFFEVQRSGVTSIRSSGHEKRGRGSLVEPLHSTLEALGPCPAA